MEIPYKLKSIDKTANKALKFSTPIDGDTLQTGEGARGVELFGYEFSTPANGDTLQTGISTRRK